MPLFEPVAPFDWQFYFKPQPSKLGTVVGCNAPHEYPMRVRPMRKYDQISILSQRISGSILWSVRARLKMSGREILKGLHFALASLHKGWAISYCQNHLFRNCNHYLMIRKRSSTSLKNLVVAHFPPPSPFLLFLSVKFLSRTASFPFFYYPLILVSRSFQQSCSPEPNPSWLTPPSSLR